MNARQPDLDWFDEYGDLQPEIAAAMAGAHREPPTDLASWLARIGEALGPGRLALGALVVGAVLAVSLILTIERHRSPDVRRLPVAIQSSAPEIARAGLSPPMNRVTSRAYIAGTGVHLRSGPGLQHKVIGKFGGGEQVDVVGEQRGWCRVTTAQGPGWVFGAFVRGSIRGDRGPAVIRRTIQLAGGRTLRSGERIFVAETNGSVAALIFPNGRRARVPTNAVARVD